MTILCFRCECYCTFFSVRVDLRQKPTNATGCLKSLEPPQRPLCQRRIILVPHSRVIKINISDINITSTQESESSPQEDRINSRFRFQLVLGFNLQTAPLYLTPDGLRPYCWMLIRAIRPVTKSDPNSQ